MPAADHQEGVVVVEERAARHQRGELLPRIDEVGVFLARRRRLAQAKNAVLAMKGDLAIGAG